MTIESPPLYIQADTYPARLDRFPLAIMYDEGVLKPTHCKVTQRGAGANFSVDIAVGSFVIQGDDQTNQGNYVGRITATENVAVTAAPGSNSRYDLVTLRVNDPNAGGNAGSNVTAVVVAGTASASPTVPALPASSIALAVIGPITTGTASITNSLINDSFGSGGPTFARSCRMIAGQVAPTGKMELIAGLTNVNGWLLCDGSAVSRSTYADLFAVVSTNYGVGDGSTTFNLPDLRDRVPVAKGTVFTTVGAASGEVSHTLSASESGVPAHLHGISFTSDIESATHTHNFTGSGPVHTRAGTPVRYPRYKIGAFDTGAFDGVDWVSPATGGVDELVADVSGTTVGDNSNHTHPINGVTQNNATASASSAHNNMQPYQVATGWLIRT